MEKRDLYYIYDSVWAGMYTDFKPFYEETRPRMEPDDILEICRYAFSYYLHWGPDAVYRYLTEDVLRRMKLYNLVMRVYPFPDEVRENSKIRYFIGMLYPKYYQFNKEAATEETYQDFVEGRLDKLPKGFYSNTQDGKERAKICFRYLINHYRLFNRIEDIYSFFNTVEGKKFLAEYKLKRGAHCFGTMADFVYESINEIPMTEEEHKISLLYKEKYKSRYFMDRYIRKSKKTKREERQAVKE